MGEVAVGGENEIRVGGLGGGFVQGVEIEGVLLAEIFAHRRERIHEDRGVADDALDNGVIGDRAVQVEEHDGAREEGVVALVGLAGKDAGVPLVEGRRPGEGGFGGQDAKIPLEIGARVGNQVEFPRFGKGQLVDGSEAAQPPSDLDDRLAVAEILLELEPGGRGFGGVAQRKHRKLGKKGTNPRCVVLREGDDAAAVREAVLPRGQPGDSVKRFRSIVAVRDVAGNVDEADPGSAVRDALLAEGGFEFTGESALDHGIEQDARRAGAKQRGEGVEGKGPAGALVDTGGAAFEDELGLRQSFIIGGSPQFFLRVGGKMDFNGWITRAV